MHNGDQLHMLLYVKQSKDDQIEKELLAFGWPCDKFAKYILGKHIQLETDPKPLVPLLNKTNLAYLLPCSFRFPLWLARLDYYISHVPGKLLYTADTLLSFPVDPSSSKDKKEEVITEVLVQTIVSHLLSNEDSLHKYCLSQQADPIC